MIRRALLAFCFLASLAPAFAQAPPPVPPLPDQQRQITNFLGGGGSTGPIGLFALYGDGTDFQNWVEVYLNGVRVNYNDPTFGWTITSLSGLPLDRIPRPITDPILTFNSGQSGTVIIVGARHPRRLTQFQETRGVSTRDLNVIITDIFAQNREEWDKLNTISGRTLQSQPGNIMGLLPQSPGCANKVVAFDATGLNPICVAWPP